MNEALIRRTLLLALCLMAPAYVRVSGDQAILPLAAALRNAYAPPYHGSIVWIVMTELIGQASIYYLFIRGIAKWIAKLEPRARLIATGTVLIGLLTISTFPIYRAGKYLGWNGEHYGWMNVFQTSWGHPAFPRY